MKRNGAKVREQILQAGLKAFAEKGFAGASVQDIIDATKVTKPVLYYYFKSKAGLYQALLDEASDESYRLVKEAAARADDLEGRLVEIFTALFDFLHERRDLLRLAFGATFASPGELPAKLTNSAKGERLFEYVHSLIAQAQVEGKLDRNFSSLELASGVYGALCFYLMTGALKPGAPMNRVTAERIVRLFLQGAKGK
jgi:AcrR family transcriptional regulator